MTEGDERDQRLVVIAGVGFEARRNLDLRPAQAGGDLQPGQSHALGLRGAQGVCDLRLRDPVQTDDLTPEDGGAGDRVTEGLGLGRRPPHRLQLPGGPGRTTTVGASGASSAGGTTRPGAVPTGSITVAPSGITACLRFDTRIASGSRLGQRLIIGARISAIRSSSRASSTISRPQKRPTISAVRSSAVGPRPPLVITSANRCSRMWASAAWRSSGRSPTIAISAASTPSSRRRSDSHGPFRSEMIPVRTSVPVIRMPARTAPYRGSVGGVLLAHQHTGPLPAASSDTPVGST